ncbi:hypothetical protein E4U25_007226, partial [Claviceps purpurea]
MKGGIGRGEKQKEAGSRWKSHELKVQGMWTFTKKVVPSADDRFSADVAYSIEFRDGGDSREGKRGRAW